MTWELLKKFIFSHRAGALIRRIAWLSMISIFISVSAFLIVLFVMNGMNQGIERRILALEPHLSVEVSGVQTPALLEVHPVYNKLKQEKNFTVSIFEAQDVVIRTAEGQFRGAVAQGISSETMIHMQQKVDELNSLKKNRDVFMERWRPDEIPEEGEVAIGIDLARSLKVNEGEFITVIPPESLLLPAGEAPRFEKIRVRKIFSTNLADIDTQFIFYQRGKAMLGLQKSSGRKLGLEVWTQDFEDVEKLKEELSVFEDVRVQTWMERNSDLFLALRLEKLMIGIFLGLAGMVSAASVVGVLSLLLFQKAKEIRLFKTLGFSSRRIIKTFTEIGLILTLCGVFSGALVGTMVSYYIQKNPLDILPDVYYDTQIPAKVDPIYIIFVILVGTLIGYLGSLFPSKGITKEENLTLRL